MALGARERIVRAADELFHEHSIQGVGIDAIIERAGVAKMSLYNHFASKDELVAEYLRARDERVTSAMVAEARSRARSPEGRALAYFDVVAERIGPGYRGCPFLNAIAEFGDAHPAFPVVVAHKERVRGFFEEQLVEARRPDAKVASESLLILLNGALSTAALRRSNRPVREARKIAQTLLGVGLRAKTKGARR